MDKSPQIIVKHNVGNTITIPNEIDVKVSSYMVNNYAAGVTSITVDNAADFSSTAASLMLSSMGAENCEIVTSSVKITNSFTVGATLQPHNRGDAVSELKYDQVYVYKNGVSFLLLNMQVTKQETVIYDKTGVIGDLYKVQWRSSIAPNEVSSFSAEVSAEGYPVNSVATIIFPVLKAMGVSENDPKINVEFCLSAVDDARKYTEAKLYGIRHAWLQEFEYPISLLAGTNYVDLPDTIDFSDTDRSVLAARFLIGNVLTPYNLRYIDKRSWNQIAFSVMGGETTAVTGIGAVSMTLNNVGDFPVVASGVAYVATSAVTETIMQIAYTGVNSSTNQLTGVTGVTRSVPVGTRVWSRPTVSQPIYYTVFDKRLYFDRIIPDSMQGTNLYIDFYKKLDEVVSLDQELPEHYREIYKWYLRYAIKYRKDIALGSDDPDLKKFEELVQALFNNLYTGQDTTIITS
jgi:hypothetical protein